MKKSLSRVLSLALVLVMLLGVMPMALARETVPGGTVEVNYPSTLKVGEEATVSPTSFQTAAGSSAEDLSQVIITLNTDDTSVVEISGTKVTGKAVGEAEITVSATYAGDTATTSFTVSVIPADTLDLSANTSTATVGQEIDLVAKLTGNSAALNNVTWSIVEGSSCASLSGSKLTCSSAGAVTLKATYPPATGDPITAEHTITIENLRFIVTMTSATFTMDAVEPKMTVTVQARTEADTSYVETAQTTNWRSLDNTVATVDENGNLTLLKAGSTEIYVDATINGETHKDVHAAVTVNNEGSITCTQNGTTTSGSSMTLYPVLSGVAENTAVTWAFELTTDNNATLSATSASTTKNSTSLTVTRKEYGIVGVKVTATWGEPARTVSTEVLFSFYDEADYTVTLKDSIKTFTFNDTKVFSKVEEGLTSFSNATGYSMMTLLTDGVSTSVTLSEAKASYNARIGKITMPGAGVVSAYDPYSSNDYILGLEAYKLVFTVLGEGEYELNYQLMDAYGSNVMLAKKGTITIVTGEAEGDIIYTTSFGKDVTFDEDDFEEFWKNSGMTGSLDHVVFEVVTSKIPYYGALYTTSAKKTSVTAYMDFEPNYLSSSKNYDLDEVTYAPNARMTTAHEETIPFTCIGTGTNPKSVSGVLLIKVGNTMPFTDVTEDDWFYEDVEYVYNNGIMNGTSTTLFSPNATLTRGMVVTMLYRIEGEPTVYTSSSFKDLTQSWYKDAVAWAAANGIVNGYSTTSFGPENAITREQLAAILYRYADYKNDSTYSNASLTKFSDYQSVSAYAEEAMKWAVYNGIITGSDGKLVPGGSATRAQAAAMFHRYLEG